MTRQKQDAWLAMFTTDSPFTVCVRPNTANSTRTDYQGQEKQGLGLELAGCCLG